MSSVFLFLRTCVEQVLRAIKADLQFAPHGLTKAYLASRIQPPCATDAHSL